MISVSDIFDFAHILCFIWCLLGACTKHKISRAIVAYPYKIIINVKRDRVKENNEIAKCTFLTVEGNAERWLLCKNSHKE